MTNNRKTFVTKSECFECKIKFAHKTYRNNRKFCSSECNRAHKINITRNKILDGQINQRATLKRHLIEIRGYQCEKCGIEDWMNLKTPLTLDHINGLASDNAIENLRLICPNCDALGNTYSGKNRGKGRKSLGMKR